MHANDDSIFEANQNFHVYGRLLIQIQNGKLYGSLHKIGEVFCHVSMNEQVQKTDPELVVETTTGSDSAKEYHLTWNSPMQFLVRSLKNDVLHIIVYERRLFSPNSIFLFNYFLVISHFEPIKLLF